MNEHRARKILPLLLLGLGFVSLGVASIMLVIKEGGESEANLAGSATNCVEPANVDFTAPDIKLQDLAMNIVALADYQGDVVLLNTWATWCPPCRAEMPDLQAFYDRYQAQGFTLIGVNIGETQQEVIQFAAENQLTFPLWLDPDELSLRALNAISLPYSVVIDREGIARYAWSGATCLTALEKTVAPLIEQ